MVFGCAAGLRNGSGVLAFRRFVRGDFLRILPIVTIDHQHRFDTIATGVRAGTVTTIFYTHISAFISPLLIGVIQLLLL